MATVEKSVGILIQATDNASPVIDGVKNKMQSLAKQTQESGQKLRTAGVAMTALGAAGLLASNNLVQGAAGIQTAMANVNTMLDKGQDAQKIYNDSINDLISTIPIAGGKIEALNGLYQVLSAGVEGGAKATMVLEEAMKAAKAGLTDTSTAVDAMTTIMNAYQIPAEEAASVSDVLFATVKRGKTTFEELAAAIGPVTAVAASVGISFEEVAATMATMTKAGFSTREAGTALRATMTSFLKPAEDMSALVQELGFETSALMVKELGLQGALNKVAKAVGGDSAALAKLFPNVESLKAVLPLTGKMAATAAEDLEAMGNAAGAAGEAFEKTADTTASQLEILNNRLEIAKEKMADGATPAMIKMKEAQVALTEAFAEANLATGGALGAIVTYGSAILTGIGPIIGFIGQIKIMKAVQLSAKAATLASAGAEAVDTGAKVVNAAATAATVPPTVAATGATWGLAAAVAAATAGISLIVAAIAILATDAGGLRTKMGDAIFGTTQYSESTVRARERVKDLKNELRGLIVVIDAVTGRMNKNTDEQARNSLEIQKNDLALAELQENVRKRGGDANEVQAQKIKALENANRELRLEEKRLTVTASELRIEQSRLAEEEDKLRAKRKEAKKDAKKRREAEDDFIGNLGADIQKSIAGIDAFTFGTDMMDSLISGFESGGKGVGEFFNDLADGIKEVFGFSLPERGPLRQVPVWGRHLLEEFGKGFEGGVPDLERRLDTVTRAIAETKVPVGLERGGGPTFNRTDNRRKNIELTQNFTNVDAEVVVARINTLLEDELGI